MQKPIGVEAVEARMRDLGQVAMNEVVSLFKGGTFALAAVLLLEIVSQSDGRLLRLVLWTSSFALALVSYNAHINSLVFVFRESVTGIVCIIAQMMTELMLFVILTPRYADQAWRGWIVIYATFHLITALRLRFHPVGGGVPIELRLKPMFDALDKGRRRSARQLFLQAFLGMIIAVPILALPPSSPWPAWLSMGAAVALMGNALFSGLRGMDRQRTMMERMLEEAMEKDAA